MLLGLSRLDGSGVLVGWLVALVRLFWYWYWDGFVWLVSMSVVFIMDGMEWNGMEYLLLPPYLVELYIYISFFYFLFFFKFSKKLIYLPRKNS
jgi:hypothetical protein